MKDGKLILIPLLLAGLVGFLQPVVLAKGRTPLERRPPADSGAGPHDFDFELGRWKIHIRRAVNPFERAVRWDELDGTTVNCKLWDGAAIQKWQADGAGGHIEGLTLRIYDPRSREWNLYAADRGGGPLGSSAVGTFSGGRGVFVDQEPMNGRMALVRSVWSQITANSVHFEAYASQDAGETWKLVLITDQVRSAGPEDCGGLAPRSDADPGVLP